MYKWQKWVTEMKKHKILNNVSEWKLKYYKNRRCQKISYKSKQKDDFCGQKYRTTFFFQGIKIEKIKYKK